MKTKLLVLLFLFGLNSYLFGQICGTPPATNEFYKSQKAIKNKAYLNTSNAICFNVFYHIVRKTDESGGYNPLLLNQVTNKLNQAFNPHNLYVNNLGFDYIDISAYYNIDDTAYSTLEFDGLVQENNRSDAINIYIVNSAPYEGKANGIISKELVITKGSVNTQIVSHEVGHCLNLWHTFHGSIAEPPSPLDPNACPENPNGFNCDNCGDYVCDTQQMKTTEIKMVIIPIWTI